MKNIKDQLLSTEAAAWRKKGISYTLVFLSLFVPYILIKNHRELSSISSELVLNYWGIAIIQTLAVAFCGSYLARRPVPNYFILCFALLVFALVIWSGMAIVFIAANA